MYTRSTDADERDLARRLEAAAVAAAAEVVTLSRADAEFVSREMSPDGICVGPKVCSRRAFAAWYQRLHGSAFAG